MVVSRLPFTLAGLPLMARLGLAGDKHSTGEGQMEDGVATGVEQ
jgi:hypothetical protein